MKILHTLISLDPSYGGPARSVPQLALALAELGHEVGIWRERSDVSALADLEDEALEKIRLLEDSFEQALKDFGRPDLVHDHGIWQPCHRLIAKVCQKQEIPLMVSPRGMLEPWALNHKKWKKRLAWWLYQRRDLQAAIGLHATAMSEAVQLRKLGLSSSIAVVPNGVKTLNVNQLSSNTEQRKRTALFLSRIHPKKGLPMLIDAWDHVRPQGWQMRVVGPDEGGHLETLKDQIGRAGLSSDWIFEPALEGDAKWGAYRDADLFILPTHSENFGIVVAEAMVAGLPVITTKGAPWELLKTKRCGWWTDISVEGMETALREATSLPSEVLKEMGERGRNVVKEQFSWGQVANAMIDCYRWILGRGTRPDCIFDG